MGRERESGEKCRERESKKENWRVGFVMKIENPRVQRRIFGYCGYFSFITQNHIKVWINGSFVD